MTRRFLIAALPIAWVLLLAGITLADDSTFDYAQFKEPPAEYRGICWMHFNLSNMSEEGVIANVQANVNRDSWGSFMIESTGGTTSGLSEAYLRGSKRSPSDQGIQYLSEEYFKFYRLAIEEGLKNKFPLSTLYDEWNYPSGHGGRAVLHEVSRVSGQEPGTGGKKRDRAGQCRNGHS